MLSQSSVKDPRSLVQSSQSMIKFRSLHSKVKDVLHSVSKYEEKNWGHSVHLAEQTDQTGPTVLWKCWLSCNNGVNVLQKYGKGGGKGGRRALRQLEFYFDASLFVIRFFVSFSLSLFSFSSPFKRTWTWTEYSRPITLPVCLCLHLSVQRTFIVRSYLRR